MRLGLPKRDGRLSFTQSSRDYEALVAREWDPRLEG